MTLLWARVQGGLALAAAVLLVLIGAYGIGHRQAKRAATISREREAAIRQGNTSDWHRRAAEARAEAVTESIEVAQDVQTLPAGDAERQLRDRWMRKPRDQR